MCEWNDCGECTMGECDTYECDYGSTCPIGNDMMCLGKEKCEHNLACEDLYYKVRLQVDPMWFVFENGGR